MKHFFFITLFCTATFFAQAQRLSVKTNLLYDLTATANLGAEVALSPKFTLDISGNYNGWNLLDGKQWQHWLVQPEARYWLCDRFNGHFFGLHGMYGNYDVYGIKSPVDLYDNHKGMLAGGGISYGYQWILGKRLNIEATIGAGYLYLKYDKYAAPNSDVKVESGSTKNYIGPTKIGVSLSYLIF
ncbi:MAG: DUF3575 domain-containing protein [Prevotellaceae bacterium]|jgi:hypothetical protein|nr:DUF3575 domain-containing protein [Prevotellaceae bacterium]